jgi:predicted nucleic acid-binding protein
MADPTILDANILLRHLTQDHPDHSPRATNYLRRIEQGEIEARLADVVIFEVVFTLQSFYRQPKALIRDALLDILSLPGIHVPRKRRFSRIFDLYTSYNLSFVDAYIAVEAERLTSSTLTSFDKGFDRIPGITRVEP